MLENTTNLNSKIMKIKIILASLLLSAFSLPLAAQTEEIEIIEKNSNVIWGIKGCLSAELPSKVKVDNTSAKMYMSGFGASLGGMMNVNLGKNFYFEPELLLFYEGYSYDNIQVVAPNSPSVNVGPQIHKLGVRLPLKVGYFINISEKWGLEVFTGPQLSYAFYGNAKSTDEEIKDNYDLMHLYEGKYAQRRFDLGWKIGVGFPVEHFLISLEADFGITNMMKSYGTMRENRLSLGIGYYF